MLCSAVFLIPGPCWFSSIEVGRLRAPQQIAHESFGLRRAANENIPTRRVSEGPTGNTLHSLAYASGWDWYVLICRTPKKRTSARLDFVARWE